MIVCRILHLIPEKILLQTFVQHTALCRILFGFFFGVGSAAEFRGGHAMRLFENLIEKSRRGKAAVISHPGHRYIRIQQFIHSMEDADIGQIIGKAHPVILFEEPGQISVGKIQLLRKILHADRLVIVQVDVIVDLIQAFFIAVAFLIVLQIHRLDHEIGSQMIQDPVTIRQKAEGLRIVLRFDIMLQETLQHHAQFTVAFAFRIGGVAPEDHILPLKPVADHHVIKKKTHDQRIVYRFHAMLFVGIDDKNIICL